MLLISGFVMRFEANQGIAEDQQFYAPKPGFDGNRTASGDLNAPADQGGNVHGATVDIQKFPFKAVLGKEALLLGYPEKRLGGVDCGVGDTQTIGRRSFRRHV